MWRLHVFIILGFWFSWIIICFTNSVRYRLPLSTTTSSTYILFSTVKIPGVTSGHSIWPKLLCPGYHQSGGAGSVCSLSKHSQSESCCNNFDRLGTICWAGRAPLCSALQLVCSSSSHVEVWHEGHVGKALDLLFPGRACFRGRLTNGDSKLLKHPDFLDACCAAFPRLHAAMLLQSWGAEGGAEQTHDTVLAGRVAWGHFVHEPCQWGHSRVHLRGKSHS